MKKCPSSLTIIGLLFLRILCTPLFAQEAKPAFPAIKSMVYGGAGLMIPSSGMKENSMIKSGVSFRIGYFYVFGRSAGRTRFGAEVRFDYTKFPADLRPDRDYNLIRYNTGSGNYFPIQVELRTLEKKPDAYQYLIGPSVLMERSRWFFQGALLFGYASLSQEKFTFTDSLRHATDPFLNRRLDFYSGGHETNNGYVLVPGIKAGYRFTRRLYGFVETNYSIGSKQEFEHFYLVPAGTQDNEYEFDELRNSTVGARIREGRFRALSVTLNLSIRLGK